MYFKFLTSLLLLPSISFYRNKMFGILCSFKLKCSFQNFNVLQYPSKFVPAQVICNSKMSCAYYNKYMQLIFYQGEYYFDFLKSLSSTFCFIKIRYNDENLQNSKLPNLTDLLLSGCIFSRFQIYYTTTFTSFVIRGCMLSW